MATIITALAAIKARAVAQITMLPMRWFDEPNDSAGADRLPDKPSPFVYFFLEMDRAETIEIGSGRGANRARANGELQGFVFTPRDFGLEASLPYAEHVAAGLRSYRANGSVTIGFASPQPIGDHSPLTPPGLASPVDNYACSLVALPIYFDQFG